MATFAVNAPEDTVKALAETLDHMAQGGEKKAETLQRIFQIAEKHAEGEVLHQNGVDTAALDAALENIRTMFTAAVSSRKQIEDNYSEKLASIYRQKSAVESELRERLAVAKEELEKAKQEIAQAKKLALQATNDAQEAKEAAQTNAELAKEKERTIESMMEKLRIAESKASDYNALLQEKAAASKEVSSLRLQLRECEAKMAQSLSDAQKDAALEKEKAVRDAVDNVRASMQDELRKAAQENGRLQAIIDMQKEQILQMQDAANMKKPVNLNND